MSSNRMRYGWGCMLKNILANAIKYSKGEAGEAFVKGQRLRP